MIKRITPLQLLAITLYVFLSLGCNKNANGCSPIDITCLDFDKCEYLMQSPLNADFSHIAVALEGNNSCSYTFELSSTDTSYYGLQTFKADYLPINLNGVEILYEWQFGTDPTIRTGQTVEIHFRENAGSSVVVNLTTTITSPSCPDSDGMSLSSSRVIHLIDPDAFSSKMLGRYRGTNNGESAERTIEIAPFLNNFQYGINNLFDGCPSNQEGNTLFVSLNYTHLLISESNSDGCQFACGGGRLSDSGHTITIDYKTKDSEGNETEHQFIGNRIDD